MQAPSAFSGFGGFSFKPTQTSTPLFAGGSFFKTESKISAEEKKESLTEKEADKRKAEETNEQGDKSPAKRQKAESNGSEQNGSSISPSQNVYLSNLKALNLSVLNWIKQHLDTNPYCILSPIFKDYENHLNEMEKERKKGSENGSGTLKKEESG